MVLWRPDRESFLSYHEFNDIYLFTAEPDDRVSCVYMRKVN